MDADRIRDQIFLATGPDGALEAAVRALDEGNRISPAEAERQLSGDDDYSSPFIAMPI